MKLEAKVTLVGRYRLERLLGEGGMGMVWEAFDLRDNVSVALKFLKGAAAGSASMHKRFAREARASMAVTHPNVVRVHEVTTADDGSPMMVMDFLRGESLESRLQGTPGRKLRLAEFAGLFQQAISGVGTAHAAGIVHRDLKPDNIFLLKTDDGKPDVRILDFGIAKLTAIEGEAAATAHLTATGAVMGTPYYMSPEQVFGEKSIDHRADIWSLGVILYECLSGRKPFDGENFGQLFKAISQAELISLDLLARELPKEITTLSTRMLEKNRDRRLGDLREAFAIFERYAGAEVPRFAAPSLVFTPAEAEAARADAFADTAVPSSPVPSSAVRSAPTTMDVDTSVPVSQTKDDHAPAPAASAPARRRTPLVIGLIAAVAAATAGIYSLRVDRRTSTPTSPAAPSVTSAPLHLATVDPWPSASPSPSASATVEPKLSADASAPARSAVPAPPAGSAPRLAAAHASASAKPITSSPATAPSKAPGGLATETPF